MAQLVRAMEAGRGSESGRIAQPAVVPRAEPFRDAEEAWFWTMASLAVRREGCGRRDGSGVIRPCDPDDVIKCLDGLYRQKRIDLLHARILRIWGERQVAPNAVLRSERGEARIWTEAMERLAFPLRMKGIIK